MLLAAGVIVAIIGARMLAQTVQLRRASRHVHVHAHPGAHPHDHEHEHRYGHDSATGHGHAHAVPFAPLIWASVISIAGALLVAGGFSQLGIAVPQFVVTLLALLGILGYAFAHNGHTHTHTQIHT